MKIAIIGAGNVGGLTAMRIAQGGLGDIVLVDVAKGLAKGKCLDLDDAASVIKLGYKVKGTDDITEIKGSGIAVITAGLARKPGMTREGLVNKNAAILKDVCVKIKELAPDCVVIVVTNPLDLMARFALEAIGFSRQRIIGMGITLDSARFANLISKELDVPNKFIDACVIGSHGEGMLPLPRLTLVRGKPLDEIIDKDTVNSLVSRTIARGKEIVSLLGSGSAYFAPSAAITRIVEAIVKDEGRVLGVSVKLSGEYGIDDVCIGVPCRIGKNGIEKIIELDLNQEEKAALQDCAKELKEHQVLI